MGAAEAGIGLEISEQEVEVPGKGPVAVAVCDLQVTRACEPNTDPVHVLSDVAVVGSKGTSAWHGCSHLR